MTGPVAREQLKSQESETLIRSRLKTLIDRSGTAHGSRSCRVSVLRDALSCIVEQDEQLKQVREVVR